MSRSTCVTETLYWVQYCVGNIFRTLKYFNVLAEIHEFLHIKYSLLSPDLNQNWWVSANCIDILNTVCDNPSSDSCVVRYPQTDKRGEGSSHVFLLICFHDEWKALTQWPHCGGNFVTIMVVAGVCALNCRILWALSWLSKTYLVRYY